MPPIESRPNEEPLNQAPAPQGLTPERIAQVTAKFEGRDRSPDALGAGLEEAQAKLDKLAQVTQGLDPDKKETIRRSLASKLEAIKETRSNAFGSFFGGANLSVLGYIFAVEAVQTAPLHAVDGIGNVGSAMFGLGALIATVGTVIAVAKQFQTISTQRKLNKLNAA